MSRTRFAYPARLEPQEDGSLLVRFPDLPEALTDGADEAEALAEASDCLSEALAGRIHRGEDLPRASPARRGLREIAPDSTIALKASLYSALRQQGATVADLACRLGIDERRAARRTPLASLEEALSVLGYTIGIEIRENRIA